MTVLFIRSLDGVNVTNVIDHLPPENEAGWRNAVEVKDVIDHDAQYYGQFYYDLTVTPAEIRYPVHNFTADQITQNAAVKAAAIAEEAALAAKRAANGGTAPA